MEIFPFFGNLAILLLSEIVIFMINWWEDFVSSNSICNHTSDNKIRFVYHDLDSSQSYYHYFVWLPIIEMCALWLVENSVAIITSHEVIIAGALNL